jgi:hypothetical protein
LSQSNKQKTFTRFENQYILMMAIRAKEDLMLELEEEKRKLEIYGNNQNFIDPNLRSFVQALTDIIVKAQVNINEYDREEFKNS